MKNKKRTRRVLYALFMIHLFLLSGCQSEISRSEHSGFPKQLVGVWQAEGSSKAFEIGGNGELVSFSNDAGLKITVKEGGIEKQGPVEGSSLLLVLGETSVHFNDSTEILKVTISYDDFQIRYPGKTISGKMNEIYQGKVDFNKNQWEVDYYTSGIIDGDSSLSDEVSKKIIINKVGN